MSDNISYDYSDIQKLERDLGTVSFETTLKAQTVVAETAGDVEADAKKLISGFPHAIQYPRSISHEMHYGLQQVSADIGPTKDGPQGALGNILEYGTRNNAPIPHLGPAMKRNEQRFVDRLADAAGDIL